LPTLRVQTPETDGESVRDHCHARGADYRLELKLETEEYRYWLCTRCVGEPFTDWREGAVIVENVQPNEYGEYEMLPYASEDLKRLQRLDYFRVLRQELDRLIQQPHSWETDKQIEKLRGEIEKMIRPTMPPGWEPPAVNQE